MRLRDIGDAQLEIVESDAIQPVATPTRGRLLPVWLTVTALVALIAGGVIGALWRQPAASPTETRWRAYVLRPRRRSWARSFHLTGSCSRFKPLSTVSHRSP